MAPQKKLRIGWFSFSCCEDSTILFTELLNDHYDTWRKVLDIRHARVLQTKNILDDLDVAFVEGALACKEHEEKVKEIRKRTKKLVAIGACAALGMPSTQRNAFPEETQEKIRFILEKFNYSQKAKRVDEVVKVDDVVHGCPMNEQKFLELLTKVLDEFGVALPA